MTPFFFLFAIVDCVRWKVWFCYLWIFFWCPSLIEPPWAVASAVTSSQMRKQKESTSKDILKQAECSPRRESFCLLPWKLMYVCIYIYIWKLMVGSWNFLLKWSPFRGHVSFFWVGKPSINFSLQIYTSLDPRIFPEDVSTPLVEISFCICWALSFYQCKY